ncbi:hypothetical protein GGI64_001867 [Rhizobium leguminosarum]|uniref:Uncharacterized protein n=2 Tax=Rhizobium leguminosarum TaxID=384 RepID=A0A7X0DQH7_RHILE|nr:hypothetical protein Rleg2_5270 [Rhizobium leguminosarum bv. trifolii WSM2304]MBB6219280.1 hypothetical protein [Rhizobium leguminosarum]NYJ10820.1 hypothetical protein [Rhizobium leguminosarum]
MLLSPVRTSLVKLYQSMSGVAFLRVNGGYSCNESG